MDTSSNRKYVYVANETVVGEKDADHVCSFFNDYIGIMVDSRAQYLSIYLDSSPYSKSKFIVWWAAEKATCGRFKRVTISFIVPVHTKFDPDLLFSNTAHRFYNTDLFKTSEILNVVSSCNSINREARPDDMRKWKQKLSEKYVSVPRITEWNFFQIELSENPQHTNINAYVPILKVKLSAVHGEFQNDLHGDITELNILKSAVNPGMDCTPNVSLSLRRVKKECDDF